MQKFKFAIIGCGRLGTNLAICLKSEGHTPVGISAKRMESIQESNHWIHAKTVDICPWNVTQKADVVFITTPDDSIEQTCRQIINHNGLNQDAIVYHCSGSLSSEILSAASNEGFSVGSLHPLQSFPVKRLDGNPFENIYISVEGSPKAIALGKIIVKSLRARLTEISTKGKKMYHAAAVVASNYLVTLLELSRQLNITAGISEDIALTVLTPLIQGTLNNIEKQGIPHALTGPIARGDIQTVQDHITSIKQSLPGYLALYKTLGKYTVPIAKAQQNISDETLLALQDEFYGK
ncbi:MAG: NAD-binding 6-phosphogluconate dehydrogenase [Candidatus Magnetoglobus multicellularis str. Araruama]|uniref:NAD-binding 6-phosphogluconate dehydrogenase n=1 Tax=Candidatus Magnetoglobus multicellularis str. Araruama TaxID=890399 RepID=A0A1V1PH22_9BACT|nr:MAG: NAD-binding 6-phosphogluconate dehydrogenase [Candidatus Magnetoglobus multicellularis str. Araruama]